MCNEREVSSKKGIQALFEDVLYALYSLLSKAFVLAPV